MEKSILEKERSTVGNERVAFHFTETDTTPSLSSFDGLLSQSIRRPCASNLQKLRENRFFGIFLESSVLLIYIKWSNETHISECLPATYQRPCASTVDSVRPRRICSLSFHSRWCRCTFVRCRNSCSPLQTIFDVKTGNTVDVRTTTQIAPGVLRRPWSEGRFIVFDKKTSPAWRSFPK